ncbi:MAG: hypothetical protein V8S10_02220 [Clostridia bacterium]
MKKNQKLTQLGIILVIFNIIIALGIGLIIFGILSAVFGIHIWSISISVGVILLCFSIAFLIETFWC